MNKQTILFIMHELSLGGAERVVHNLINNMNREEFKVELCLFKKKGILVNSIKSDVKIYDLKATRVLTSTFKFIKLLITQKPDIVFTSITHVNLLVAFLIPFLKLFMPKTLFVTREVNIPSIRAKYITKSKKLDFFYKRVINNYDYIIAQSNYMKNDIVKSYNIKESKIYVVNNPLDISIIQEKLENNTKTNLFADKNKINIVAVGNLRKQKGFEQLLEVMLKLDDNYHLNIIGNGAERNFLEDQIDILNIHDKVTFHGSKTNPYIYMQQADIVALTSRYEGFPNVILEANACGKFVVAFKCPGVSEEIIQNDINGFLVENENINSFAKAICKYSHIFHDKQKIINTTKRYYVHNIVKEYNKIFLGENYA